MKLAELKVFCRSHVKVISNYFHMTILQVMNSFFYILIYPFIINSVGVESYGLYVFATSISTYFIVFVTFGFDMHAAKLISLSPDDRELHASLLSSVLVAKLILELLAIFVFFVLIMSVPFMKINWQLFTICFFNTLSSMFLPTWYFHGLQRMKVLTIIQLFLKLLSLPIIFLLISRGDGIEIYALIVVLTNILSSVVAHLIAMRSSKVRLYIPRWASIGSLLKDVQPFFWSSATNTFKQKSIEVIIGSLFGMKELAIYDLANKIFSVPSLLASNVNAALFPIMVKKAKKEVIKKIIKVEFFIGLLCMLAVAIGGSWVVKLVSVHDMQHAYYLSMLLSINIMTFLVVGSHIYFIYVPHQRYDLVLRNQIVSVVSFYFLCTAYLMMSWSIYSVVLALVTSALLEILYSYSLVRKVKEY